MVEYDRVDMSSALVASQALGYLLPAVAAATDNLSKAQLAVQALRRLEEMEAPLLEERRRLARALRDSGVSINEVAVRIGVSKSRAAQILRQVPLEPVTPTTPRASAGRKLSTKAAPRPLPSPDETYLETGDVARLLHTGIRTLTRWRLEGKGPPFVIVSRKVLYPQDELHAFIKRQAKLQARRGP